MKMLKSQLVRLINKNGLKESEEILINCGFSLKEIKEMLESVKEYFLEDGWDDCYKKLKCYKT